MYHNEYFSILKRWLKRIPDSFKRPGKAFEERISSLGKKVGTGAYFSNVYEPVLRIRDILVRIRIRASE
jgi:hypothetical protein